MLYISGENDTIQTLKDQEDFQGSLQDYIDQFNKLNGKAFRSADQPLPEYTPFCLVTDAEINFEETKITISEITCFNSEERKTLRKMQIHQYDVFSLLGLRDIMEGLQNYSKAFRNKLDQPLISSPWDLINNNITNQSFIDILEETTKFGAKMLEESTLYTELNKLYYHMNQRDILNRQLYQMYKLKGFNFVHQRKMLEISVKEHTRMIKQLLPKNLKNLTSRYLNGRFSLDEMRKIRPNSASLKSIRKGNSGGLTLKLEFLNRSGLQKLRSVIGTSKNIANGASHFGTFLNVAVVGYDTYDAYKNKTGAARTFFKGSVGVGVGIGIGAWMGLETIGALTVGALVGDMALGTTVLLCCPVVGWIIGVSVGLIAVGYATSKIEEAAGELWDEYTPEISKAIASFADQVRSEIVSAWSSSSRWFLELYGEK